MPSSTSATSPVVILLASYDGAAYLPAQLDSIAAQSFPNWSLLISDDGSTDGTRDIAAGFAASRPPGQVRVIDGPRQGATQNFLHLIEATQAGTALAFCDQDDVWHVDKLARAMAALSGHDGPAHYAARTIICDENLAPLTESRHFNRPFGFRNALVQACMAGNTSVFNPAAADLLKRGAAAARAAQIESHDWWAYQLTAGAGAKILRDPDPVLLYRQHGRSEMGRNDTLPAMTKRVGQLFEGSYGAWLGRNCEALERAAHLLTSENAAILSEFRRSLHQPGPLAATTFRRLGLYRHTRAGTLALYSAAALGRLRQPPPSQVNNRSR